MMSHQRVVAGRCTSSSSVSAAAGVPCIHRPFEDPPASSSSHRPAAAFPDSTATLLYRPSARGKTADVSGAGLVDSLQRSSVDWSNTSVASTVASSAAGTASFCADGVDSSSSDSELQYSNSDCIHNSSPDDYAKKRT